MDQPKKEVVHSSFEKVTAAFYFFCIIFVSHVKVSHVPLYNNNFMIVIIKIVYHYKTTCCLVLHLTK